MNDEDFKYDVFISYSRKDTAEVDKLCRVLDMIGISYFIDWQNIVGGMEFPIAIAGAILHSRLFLIMASENAYGSKFTNNELTYAYSKKSPEDIVLFNLDGSTLPPGVEMATQKALKLDRGGASIESDFVLELYRRLHDGNNPDDELMYRIGQKFQSVEEKYEDYLNWTLPAAWNGHPDACYVMGCEFILDADADNAATAMDFLKTAWDKGIVEAGLVIGHLLRNGAPHFPQSPQQAFEWYRKAALKDSLGDGPLELGRCYLEGFGTDEDLGQAEYWLKLARDAGKKEADDLLHDSRFKGKSDFDAAMDAFIDSRQAEINHELAQLKKDDDSEAAAGHLLESAENGFKLSVEELLAMHRYQPESAKQLLRSLADDGDSEARKALADLYLAQGGSRREDLFKALEHYLRIPSDEPDQLLPDSHPVIQAILNRFSEEEIDKQADTFYEKENVPASAQLMKLEARMGNFSRSIDLGCLYLLGKGLKTDGPLALKYLKAGAEHGDTYANATVGKLLNCGEFVERNPEEAFSYFEIAAKQGDSESMFNYGTFLLDGIYCPMNQEEGLRWIRRAAEENFPDAQFSMYNLCKTGPLKGEDPQKWLDLAATNGHMTAMIYKEMENRSK